MFGPVEHPGNRGTLRLFEVEDRHVVVEERSSRVEQFGPGRYVLSGGRLTNVHDGAKFWLRIRRRLRSLGSWRNGGQVKRQSGRLGSLGRGAIRIARSGTAGRQGSQGVERLGDRGRKERNVWERLGDWGRRERRRRLLLTPL